MKRTIIAIVSLLCIGLYAKADPIDVKCTSWDLEDWGEDGELTLYGEDGNFSFYFDLYYRDEASDLQLGKIYTVDDIFCGSDGQYAGVFYDDDWHYGIKELSLVKTVDENGLVHFTGSTIDSFDNQYTFHYDEAAFVITGDTIPIAFTCFPPIVELNSDGSWDYIAGGKEYGYKVELCYFSDNDLSCAGSFDTDDMDIPFSSISEYVSDGDGGLKRVNYDIKECEIDIVEADKAFYLTGNILASNGNVYSLDIVSAIPIGKDTVEIILKDPTIDDIYYSWFGFVTLDFPVDSNRVQLWFSPQALGSGMMGHYIIGKDGTQSTFITEYENEEVDISGYSGEFDVSFIGDDMCVTGFMICNNNVLYKFIKVYPTSINIEQQVLDNGVGYDIHAGLADAGFYFKDINALDSLNDKVIDRNEPYLGLSIDTIGGFIACNLKAGDEIRVKFGYVSSPVNAIAGSDTTVLSPTNGKLNILEYKAKSDVIVKIESTGTDTMVVKQIMINEPIAEVELPAFVQTFTLAVLSNDTLKGKAAVTNLLGSGIIDNQDGTYTIPSGIEVTILATSADGYLFSSWSEGLYGSSAECSSCWTPINTNVNPLTITITEDISIMATFINDPEANVIELENGIQNVKAVKILKDGIIRIQKEDNLYNLQGIEQ